MPNYYQHNGTSYVHVSDFAALEARLAEEVKNKKEFERDWLAACDELCNTRSRLADWHRMADERSAEIVRLSARLAEAEALLREWVACATNIGSGEAVAKVEQAFIAQCRTFLAADKSQARDE